MQSYRYKTIEVLAPQLLVIYNTDIEDKVLGLSACAVGLSHSVYHTSVYHTLGLSLDCDVNCGATVRVCRSQRGDAVHRGSRGPPVPLVDQELHGGCSQRAASGWPGRGPTAAADVLDGHAPAPHQPRRGAQRQRRHHATTASTSQRCGSPRGRRRRLGCCVRANFLLFDCLAVWFTGGRERRQKETERKTNPQTPRNRNLQVRKTNTSRSNETGAQTD